MNRSFKSAVLTLAVFALLLVMTGGALAEERKVFFENLKNGDVLGSPFVVKMGVKGVVVKPLAAPVDGEGHHHLIINGSAIEKGVAVPVDERHIHFGKGQTESSVELKPGEYTLTLQFANGIHQSYGPELSDTVKVTVK